MEYIEVIQTNTDYDVESIVSANKKSFIKNIVSSSFAHRANIIQPKKKAVRRLLFLCGARPERISLIK